MARQARLQLRVPLMVRLLPLLVFACALLLGAWTKRPRRNWEQSNSRGQPQAS